MSWQILGRARSQTEMFSIGMGTRINRFFRLRTGSEHRLCSPRPFFDSAVHKAKTSYQVSPLLKKRAGKQDVIVQQGSATANRAAVACSYICVALEVY
jgi:hypothetical protein